MIENSGTLIKATTLSPDPNERQSRAAIPEHDVWVAASAGSGKTKVLTDRVLRLLLPDPEGKWKGSAPHKILCITFTKAAAALMSIRIQKRLGEWAIMGDEELSADLAKLIGRTPDAETMTRARQLFTKVLDIPGGMAIMTIHSFCQSVLGRFPLEAGLTPGFRIIEETQATELLSSNILALVTNIESGKRPDLEDSFARIALAIDIDALKSTLLSLTKDANKLRDFLKKNGTGNALHSALLQRLGLLDTDSPKNILRNFVTNRPIDKLTDGAKILGASPKPSNHKYADQLARWIALPTDEKIRQIDLFRLSFLTTNDTVRKFTKDIQQDHAHLLTLLESEREQLFTALDKIAAWNQAQITSDLLTLASEIISSYAREKRRRNALDFDDLIIGTRELLEKKGQDWVHYKLDEGLDHILVDEAQDTNIHQWKIIEHLSEELQSGWGRETDAPRSLFVVGDKKQSIFRFQGAAPEAFTAMRHMFAERSKAAERVFDIVNLETSFRTTEPVLALVDQVFAAPALSSSLGLEDGEHLTHYSFRQTAPGKVELWDVQCIEKTKREKLDTTWQLPLSAERKENDTAPSHNLATKIATRIKQMIASKMTVPSTGAPVEPRDILVLVRTRTGSFITDLTRQLKSEPDSIAVSGIDRMALREQIAVEDCLALARFCRLQSDDLSLACLLKSPFIRLSDEELMLLAIGRHKDETLWDRAQANLPPETIIWLKEKIEDATGSTPFDFFNESLACPCPYDNKGSARRAFADCLGPDCLDPLDEFLNYCLSLEEDGIFGLEDVVTHMEKSDHKIKRESGDAEKDSSNQVRIMTVHASKGLEAPIVFLPDTTSLPNPAKTEKFLWIEENENTDFPLWTSKADESCKIYKHVREEQIGKDYAEYLRLLYVALTRARDHLYIAGELKGKGFSENAARLTWYQLVAQAFDKLPDIKQSGTTRVFEKAGSTEQKEQTQRMPDNIVTAIPSWLPQPPPKEEDPRHFVQPSLLGKGNDAALSPLQSADSYRFERGNLTHRLFEFLPDIAPENRRKAAELFLKKSGGKLPENIHEDIISEVFAILDDPVFAPVFGPDSLAEISVTGEIGQGKILSGQIDRLIVGKERILIVDFKSNRPSPQKESDIPQNYRDQLKAYKSAISKIYPDKPIDCALLWTDKAILMPIAV